MSQARLPQQHEYQHLGAFMRDLRGYYGLDVHQVAERIHVRAKYVVAIEEGRLEQMPGKVYARGYIVTYAEFLGLDAEAIATEYMQEHAEAPREQVYFVPEPKRVRVKAKTPAGLYVVGGLVVLAAAFFLIPRGSSAPSVETPSAAVAAQKVEDVPEQMIANMRNAMMPGPRNYDCLMSDASLACQQAISTIPIYAMHIDVPVQWMDATKAPVVEEAAPAEDATTDDVKEEAAPAKKEPEVKPATKPEPKAEVKATAKPEAKAAAKPEAKQESKPAVEAVKPESDAAKKADAKPDEKTTEQAKPAAPELTPAAVIPDAKPATADVKPAEPKKSTDWWIPSLPSDPNGPHEDLFPRRRN